MKKAFIKGIMVVVFLLGSIGLSGCDLLYNVYENVISNGTGAPEPGDLTETGAWNEGMFWCGDYRVNLECPEVGHPSGLVDSEWSTGCELDDGTYVFVDFFSREGSIEDRISELENEGIVVGEGVLWDNSCYFYVDDVDLVTIVLIEVDENNYIQIEFRSRKEEIGVEFEQIPDTFTLTIGN